MNEKYGTRFFSPLLPGFTKKLLVPQELAKNIDMVDTRKVATIVTSGKIWQVEFYEEMEDYYMGGKGWENFVEAHGLKDLEMLVFRYRGNMVFTLRIFDKITCCEKIYPYGSRSMGVGESVVQKPTKSSCRKRKVEELSHTTISEDEVPAETEGNCSRKFSFETTINAYHLSGRRLFVDIPSEFIEEQGEFMLRDPQGQTWPVTLSKGKQSGAYISKGWLKFARGNKLKEGDMCIFELLASSSQQRKKKKKRVINFKIRKIDQTTRTPKPAPEDSDSPENHNTPKRTMTRGAHFEVTITACQLSRYYLYVPRSFQVAACLEKLSRVVLIDPKRRCWWFELRHIRNKANTDTYLTKSWREFAVGNRLRGGDKCIFELVPEENSSSSAIRVQILRMTKQE